MTTASSESKNNGQSPHLSAEMELLVACVRSARIPGEAQRIGSLIRNGLNEPAFLDLAHRHRVALMVYRTLQEAGADAALRDILGALREYVRTCTYWSHVQTQELHALYELLHQNDIPVIAFKGLVLSAMVYGDSMWRTSNDIDLLVHAQDVLRATELLRSRGYRQCQAPRTAQQEAADLRSKNQYAYYRGRFKVEIHWRISPEHYALSPDDQELWERSEAVELSSKSLRSLSREDTLLLLCVHGSKHGWEKLSWICDLTEFMIRHSDLDWAGIRRDAQRFHSKRRLLAGLLLAKRLLDAPVPDALLEEANSDRALCSLADSIVRRILSGEQWIERPSSITPFDRYNLQMMDRWQDRLRLAIFLLTRVSRCWWTPDEKDRAFLSLPQRFASLYYLVRPLRILATRISGDRESKLSSH